MLLDTNAEPWLPGHAEVTDVENELNGLITYDRAVLKVDPKNMTAFHQILYSAADSINGNLKAAASA